MRRKSQIETIVEKLRSDLGLDVKLVDGTDYATVTIDAMGLSPAAWFAFTQLPAMRSAVDLCKSADELRARLMLLKKQSEIAAYEFAEVKGALVRATFKRFVHAPWPRRSKPARRAMAKLAARRGRRG